MARTLLANHNQFRYRHTFCCNTVHQQQIDEQSHSCSNDDMFDAQTVPTPVLHQHCGKHVLETDATDISLLLHLHTHDSMKHFHEYRLHPHCSIPNKKHHKTWFQMVSIEMHRTTYERATDHRVLNLKVRHPCTTTSVLCVVQPQDIPNLLGKCTCTLG